MAKCVLFTLLPDDFSITVFPLIVSALEWFPSLNGFGHIQRRIVFVETTCRNMVFCSHVTEKQFPDFENLKKRCFVKAKVSGTFFLHIWNPFSKKNWNPQQDFWQIEPADT